MLWFGSRANANIVISNYPILLLYYTLINLRNIIEELQVFKLHLKYFISILLIRYILHLKSINHLNSYFILKFSIRFLS